MLNRIAIIFGVCLFFISSCKKDKEVYPIVLSTPSDFRLYAKPGDIVSISIKVTSEIQLRQFILKTQIVNELEIVELDSAINNKSFEYYFQYKVPETAAGRLIYLTYIAYDIDGNQGKNLQQIFVSDLTLKETAIILNISERTLQRYIPTDILSKDVSDRTLHLQRLYERGTDVFGSLNNFKSWMKTPVLIFNNQLPISFLDTIFGFELLEDELGRIEHGIFA